MKNDFLKTALAAALLVSTSFAAEQESLQEVEGQNSQQFHVEEEQFHVEVAQFEHMFADNRVIFTPAQLAAANEVDVQARNLRSYLGEYYGSIFQEQEKAHTVFDLSNYLTVEDLNNSLFDLLPLDGEKYIGISLIMNPKAEVVAPSLEDQLVAANISIAQLNQQVSEANYETEAAREALNEIIARATQDSRDLHANLIQDISSLINRANGMQFEGASPLFLMSEAEKFELTGQVQTLSQRLEAAYAEKDEQIQQVQSLTEQLQTANTNGSKKTIF